jgi:hypothetical protein
MGPFPSGSAFDTGSSVTTHLLGIISAQQSYAGRPAPGCVIELGIAKSGLGQPVQVWGKDLSSVTTRIGIPQVIGKQY